MRIFFIICAVFGATALVGSAVLLFVFGIKFRPVFTLREGTVPLRDFIPRSVYGFSVFAVSFGAAGQFLDSILPIYITLPFCIAFALIINFFGVHILLPFAKDLFYGKKPKPAELEGRDAVTLEFIGGEDYGKVSVEHGGRTFIYDCIPANHTDLAKSETVTIITGEDNLLFVQKKEELLLPLHEDDSGEEGAEAAPEKPPEPKRKRFDVFKRRGSDTTK